jgi:hypothetical protein
MRKLATEPSLGRGRYSNAALIAGQLAEPELAVTLLGKAYLGPGRAGQSAIWLPQLADARKTDGFKTLIRDVGFVEMWRKSGDGDDFCRPVADDFQCT